MIKLEKNQLKESASLIIKSPITFQKRISKGKQIAPNNMNNYITTPKKQVKKIKEPVGKIAEVEERARSNDYYEVNTLMSSIKIKREMIPANNLYTHKGPLI